MVERETGTQVNWEIGGWDDGKKMEKTKVRRMTAIGMTVRRLTQPRTAARAFEG